MNNNINNPKMKLMKRYIYDGILESHEAREMAENNEKVFGVEQTEADAAKEWFGAVVCDGEGRFDDMPMYYRLVESIDDDWDLYYDYGADYYFAVHNNMEKE
jgi:hypothetical protein